MNYYGTTFWSPTDLTHYGVLGMKWGVRRYQNKDGSLTAAGQKRYYKQIVKANSKKDAPKDAPKIGDELSSAIDAEVKKNANIFQEAIDSANAIDDFQNRFFNNKELVQKYILEAYDKGVPFDDYQLKSINGDITESLKSLWKDPNASSEAFTWYIMGEGKDEYRDLSKRYQDAHVKQLEYANSLVDSFLGKYGNKTVKSINPLIYNSQNIYPKAANIVIPKIFKQSRKYTHY